ncbi:MAG: biotin transporter BioY [Spirochaetaceae bacterium]|jgi:biotin transport system substrate-specific component|nr:biotin transporter BioY [Spirochaetaceae bacterium]
MRKKRGGTAMRNRSVFVALFAALISATCFIAIPTGPMQIPIVIQNMMVVLAGTVLGGTTGAASVLLFLIAGAVGLPVFSGGTSGFAKFIGPTGGFLIGYLCGALCAGLILGKPSLDEVYTTPRMWIKTTLAVVVGSAVVYIFGIPWLASAIMRTNSMSFQEALPGALAAGVVPFIPGAIIKIVISVPLTCALRPIAARYLNPGS